MNWSRLPLVLLALGALAAPLAAQEQPQPPLDAPTGAPQLPLNPPRSTLQVPLDAPASTPRLPLEAPTSTPQPLLDAPTSGLPEPQDGPMSTLSPDTRLTPRPPTALFAREKETNSNQLVVYFVVLVAMAGAGLYFLKRGLPLRGTRGGENNLKLLETKMLGNRQFLVVAQYKDNKVLIGVGPGQIQYLCSLDNADDDLENLIQKTGQLPGQDLA